MQGLGERSAAALASGEGAHPLARQVVETDEAEHPAYLAVPGFALGPLLQGGHVVDEAERGEAARVAALLRQVAESATDAGALLGHVRIEARGSGIDRRLARARWPGSAAASSCRRRWDRAGR